MFDELVRATQPTRTLARADPSTFVEGGGNTGAQAPGFRDTDPSKDDLERWFHAWAQGGPVGALLDKRALMIFGVGSEWVTDDEDQTIPERAPTDDPEDPGGEVEELSVADWLERVWPTRARDEWFIRTAQTAYWAGFATWEPITTKRPLGGGDKALVPNDGPIHGFEYVHPPTINAFWDDKGEIENWVQTVRSSRFSQRLKAELGKEQIVHVTLNPKGRNPMGLSLVGRAWDDIQNYVENKRGISEALRRFAYAGFHVKVGKEDGPAIDDNELRRVKQRIKRVEGAKNLVTGQDIDISPLEAGSFGEGINNIRDRDIQDLATALDVPLEWTNYAGDGLGTGKPAESRMAAFERSARGEQRRMATHAVEFARRLIAEGPFPDDIHIDLSWGDVVSDQAAVADWLSNFKATYTHNEVRQKLGDGPVPEEADIDGDAPVQEEDVGDAGAGGGIFGMSGGPDTGNRRLSERDGLEPWERALDGVFERVVWGEDTGRSLFSFDPEDVPQFAIDNLRVAILGGGLFEDFENIPSSSLQELRNAMLDSLEEQHGWSVDSVASNIQDVAPSLTDAEAERIARTETAAVTNKAREIGYEERGLDDARFYWQGPADQRTTEACEWLKEQTNPQFGGEPVSKERLKALVGEANDRFVDHDRREWSVHINERHTWVRATGAV